jgi:hypothetical protein
MRRGYALALLAFVAVAIYLPVAGWYEYHRSPLLRENLARSDYAAVYDLYTGRLLTGANRSAEGDPATGVTIVAVVDFTSAANKAFYDARMPEIEKMYVETGQARLYHRYYLPQDELEQRKGRFIYAAAATCFSAAGGHGIVSFNQALFNATPEEVGALAARFNLSPSFEACLADPPRSLAEDSFETERFRISAPSLRIGVELVGETVLVGSPSMDRIGSAVKAKQITLGAP